MFHVQFNVVVEQAFQQVGYIGDHVGQLQHLGPQRLLAGKGQQLPGQARGPIAVVLDLLDIVIVAVARSMAEQHQVAMADDRRQDIVEVMGHTAGQLSDGLHLCRLGDLALQFRFLAIVADREQDCRIAQPAHAGNAQRDRLLPAVTQAHRKIAGHRGAAGIAPDGIGDRGLVITNHQIAGIERLFALPHAGSPGKRLVEEQEPAITVGEREAKRQQ